MTTFLKVHIISDGTPQGTKVIDLATGKDIPVVEIKWKIAANEPSMCMLTLPYCPIECKAERVLIVDDEGDLRHIVRPLPVREKLTAIRKWFAGEA